VALSPCCCAAHLMSSACAAAASEASEDGILCQPIQLAPCSHCCMCSAAVAAAAALTLSACVAAAFRPTQGRVLSRLDNTCMQGSPMAVAASACQATNGLQQWVRMAVPGDVVPLNIRNTGNNLCLSSQGGWPRAGIPVTMAACSNDPNQKVRSSCWPSQWLSHTSKEFSKVWDAACVDLVVLAG
jgi:hypothetical protein